MIAINKHNGDIFKIKKVSEFFFEGICVKSPLKKFSQGERIKKLDKIHFYLHIEWEDLEKIHNMFKNFLL